MTWPMDDDGDVFRALESERFDFSRPHAVDYNVDFKAWPPPARAIALLRERFGEVELFEPEDDSDGHILYKVTALVTYEGVTSIQRWVTAEMMPFGGVCDSWGVWGAS